MIKSSVTDPFHFDTDPNPRICYFYMTFELDFTCIFSQGERNYRAGGAAKEFKKQPQ